jgi:hypothetical protein
MISKALAREFEGKGWLGAYQLPDPTTVTLCFLSWPPNSAALAIVRVVMYLGQCLAM